MLPSIEDSVEDYSKCTHQNVEQVEPTPLTPEHTGSKLMTPTDNSTWQVGPNGYVSKSVETRDDVNYYLYGNVPNKQDLSRFYWKAGSQTKPKNSVSIRSKRPTKGFVSQSMSRPNGDNISQPVFSSWNYSPEMTPALNTNAFMPIVAGGQDNLRRHLKRRQVQRALDQQEFISQSVTGRTVSTQATYTVNYGDLEVPTTDVEMFAILSVEKHNLPLHQEVTYRRPQYKHEVPLAEKISQRIDQLTHQDGRTRSEINPLSYVRTLAKHEGVSVGGGRSPQHLPDTRAADGITRDPGQSSPLSANKQPPKDLQQHSGPLVSMRDQSDVTRSTKWAPSQKYYDSKRPRHLQRRECLPLLLEPLISTLNVGDNTPTHTSVGEHEHTEINKCTKPQPTGTEDDSLVWKVERRNILVQIPAATDDMDDDLTTETSQSVQKSVSGSRHDVVMATRPLYTPNKVQLGDLEGVPPAAVSRFSPASSALSVGKNSEDLFEHNNNAMTLIPSESLLRENEEPDLTILGSGVTQKRDNQEKNAERLTHSADSSRDQPSDYEGSFSPASQDCPNSSYNYLEK